VETVFLYKLPIPSWAMCYLINGDADSLSLDEKWMVDGWYQSLFDTLEPGEEIILSPVNGREYFLWFPEFGQASMVQDCWVKIVKEETLCVE